LRVAVWTDKPDIFNDVIIGVSVDVVNYKRQVLAVPFAPSAYCAFVSACSRYIKNNFFTLYLLSLFAEVSSFLYFLYNNFLFIFIATRM